MEILKLKNQHEAVGTCGTLTYGKLGDSFAAIKEARYFYMHIHDYEDRFITRGIDASDAAIKQCINPLDNWSVVLYSTDEESILGRENKVIIIECSETKSDNPIVSDEWLKEIGADKLVYTGTLAYNRDYLALADVLIPTVPASNGSRIPVLWVEQVEDEIKVEESLLVSNCYGNIENDEMYRDAIKFITEKYPAVDLDTEEDKRFVSIALNTGMCDQVTICYNRNHSAYNGTISVTDMIRPIAVAKYASICYGEDYDSDIRDFLLRESEHFKVYYKYQIGAAKDDEQEDEEMLLGMAIGNGSGIVPSFSALADLT